MKRYAKEILERVWFGVTLPKFLRAFDCRGSTWERMGKRILLSSEKAAADIGLLNEQGADFSTTPLSCSTYLDSQTATEAELRKQVDNMVGEAEKLKREYDEVVLSPGIDKGLGGMVVHFPLAICLSNFGWCILSDRRQGKTRFFQ